MLEILKNAHPNQVSYIMSPANWMRRSKLGGGGGGGRRGGTCDHIVIISMFHSWYAKLSCEILVRHLKIDVCG